MAVWGNCGGLNEIWNTKKTLGENRSYAGQKGKNMQEGLADSGMMVHHSTVQQCLPKQDLHISRRKPNLHYKIQHQKYATGNLLKLNAFSKQVLRTDGHI